MFNLMVQLVQLAAALLEHVSKGKIDAHQVLLEPCFIVLALDGLMEHDISVIVCAPCRVN